MCVAYERRLSGTEAREGRIMVLKSALGCFPPVGEAFELGGLGRTTRVAVEAEPCVCRGPEKPHEHYFIAWPGLEAGARVRIEPVGEPGRYSICLCD